MCATLASLLLYGVLFGAVLDRPLELGFLAREIDAKLARAATIHGPKLVILAGSNGPYSHRCQVIEPMLELPCVNGGVAVGIGLDYLFIALARASCIRATSSTCRWSRSNTPPGVRPPCWGRTPPSCSAMTGRHSASCRRDAGWPRSSRSTCARRLMSVIEMSLVAARFHDPRAEAAGTNNAWGDHVGHSVGARRGKPGDRSRQW